MKLFKLFATAALVASALASHSAALAQSAAGKIPVEVFYKRSAFTSYQLSPDGTKLSVIAPVNGRNNLVVVDLEKRSRTNITNFDTYDVADVNWITNDRLWFRAIEGRDVANKVTYQGSYAINIDGTEIRNMEALRGAPKRSRLVKVVDRKTGDIIIAANLRRSAAIDLYLSNTRSNKLELLTFDSPADTGGFLLDKDNVPRLAITSNDTSLNYTVWFRKDAKSPWESLQTSTEGAENWWPISFRADGKLLVSTNIGRDKAAIAVYDPVSRTMGEVLAESNEIDLGRRSDFVNLPDEEDEFGWNPLILKSDPEKPNEPAKVVGIRYNGYLPYLEWFDPELKALQATIDKALPDRVNRFSATSASEGKKVLVNSASTTHPVRTYLYDPAKKALEEVPAGRPWLPGEDMPTRSFEKYIARDGLPIPAYLTLPRDHDSSKKLPLVVHIHGGPYLRNYGPLDWGQMDTKFLASRGYAVLEPEPRGSQGFGRKHFTAGFKTWGLQMQDDITDGVKHLIAKGIVDPKRVCLYGGSYGGYATLQGLVREPDMFKCGLATVAVTDLFLFQETTWSDTGVNTKASAEFFTTRVGSVDKDREQLERTSPARNADKIKVPVFLVMGESDVRVPQIHGTKMVEGMKKAGVDFTYQVYVGEGHGWQKDENRFDAARRMEAFFAKHIGGGAK
jgi:dipeptidyl aminopeptidase/acylaminoacyl peptidase